MPSNKINILIVDDSQTLRSQLRTILERAGYTVLEAQNGEEGLKTLESSPHVKLVLCDVNMPVMDGLSMASEVHRIPEHKSLPILMLTSESDLGLKAKGKEAGVLAWITKPLNEPKLLGAVKKILETGGRGK